MINIYFRHQELVRTWDAKMPGVPRVGEQVTHMGVKYTVLRVIWHTDVPESEDQVTITVTD